MKRREFLKLAAAAAVVPAVALEAAAHEPARPLLNGRLGNYEGFRFIDVPKYELTPEFKRAHARNIQQFMAYGTSSFRINPTRSKRFIRAVKR